MNVYKLISTGPGLNHAIEGQPDWKIKSVSLHAQTTRGADGRHELVIGAMTGTADVIVDGVVKTIPVHT